MAISANGIGSGLDINGIIQQLMAVEQRPLAQLAAKEGSYQAQLSAFGQIKSALSTFQSAADALNNGNRFSAMRATSSNSSAFTATAETSAVKGSYALEVLQIAQGQRLITNESTAPAVAAGSLTINTGSYQYDNDGVATGFTQTGSVTIDLDAGSTLEELRDAINDADAGVRASIIDNGTAKQLVIAGSGEGAESAFTLQGSDGLSGFSYDALDEQASTLTTLETAQDAKLRLDSVTLTRSSNTLTDVIDGVTINLLAPTETKGTLSIVNDRSGAKTAIESFVKAYNEISTALRGLTAYDSEKGQASILTGDATVRSLQGQLRNALGAVTRSPEGGVSSLSELGISFQRNGTLTINSSTLDAKLNDPDARVAEFFAGREGVQGFAATLSARLGGYLNSGGVLESRQDGINNAIRGLDRQRETLARRLEQTETRYRAQFTALDSMVASMQQTSTFLTQQLANLPRISSGN